ncbi:GHKL domain protein [Leptospira interrogans str. 2003000735]|uniref:GHKL domain protein n=1 Tax=Leptospira interrogans serovar Australis str. 200703203 TaxID=1085541 RepID=N1UFB0_LEPIR|nr:HSP90 family protein [Leptospira interrogans]EMY22581.1 GHKL domain protein [Leptospira interrogans serovar Australis str. 200703203]EKN86146.1 GHKL domain protein [Leptospira interrogans str. 2002000624]EKQ39468.1 GHKL domain protein [Leptospira interrogans str. 2002000621]EKQ45591.1 GHKL domain protein [Leptospira interrogans str. 2002000623]EMJ73495.1 GHKL domain protein [Leptospira interrogans str. 2002000632]
MSHKFQVNLRGIINLLSEHLYSGPQVFVRELLQNGVDAIQARSYLEPENEGEIHLEIIPGKDGTPPTLIFTDNGVGLVESEIHEFLATIGQSSKRGEFQSPKGFIGQFGVGLLSCFIVSDEVVVVTRSVKDKTQPAFEWRGKQDGTYSIKTLGSDLPFGTQVYLLCKPGSEEYFERETLCNLVKKFGGLLSVPLQFLEGESTELLNPEPAPWNRTYRSKAQERKTFLDFGKKLFETSFFDAIPLTSDIGKVQGIAFVLPYSPSLAQKNIHRIYLKNMLLSESAASLLPDWAFFVKCVVNSDELRPTASREDFYEDQSLEKARETLGQCLRDYLIALSEDEPERLRHLINLHHLSMKALAVQDSDFFRLIIDFLPFETTFGRMTLKEFREKNPVIRYVSSHDQYRQISGVAAAQGEAIINGGYVYDSELLERFSELYPVEQVDAAGFAQTFEDITLEERDSVFDFLQVADQILRPFQCVTDIKKFLPIEMPMLYHLSQEGDFLRSVEHSKEIANKMWSDILNNLSDSYSKEINAYLFFNLRNPLIQKLVKLKDVQLIGRAVQMLYIQALLMGHHPLHVKELSLLTGGLSDLIEGCINNQIRENQ